MAILVRESTAVDVPGARAAADGGGQERLGTGGGGGLAREQQVRAVDRRLRCGSDEGQY